MNKQMTEMYNAVTMLSEKFEFDVNEAIAYLEAEKVLKPKKSSKKVKIEKPNMLLPFVNVIDGLCGAVSFDGGLYTQCKRVAKEKYCTTCAKQAGEGKPKYGDISDRVEQGDEWRSPDGKAPVLYGKVMQKKGLLKEEAIAEAAKFGWVIPEEQFEVSKPKKEAKKTGGKRGRPSKEKAVETGKSGDDLIAQLVLQAQQETDENLIQEDPEKEAVKEEKKSKVTKKEKKPKMTKEAKEAEKLKAKEAKEAEKLKAKEAKEAEKLKAKEAEKKEKKTSNKKEKKPKMTKKERASKKEEKEESIELKKEEEEEVVEVKKFEFEGIEYLLDANNVMYDMKTQDEIGSWDDNEKKIVPLADDHDDDDEEE
jgi:chemotaxis protein histidine kinase CheA